MGVTIGYVALSGMLGTTKNMALQYVILIIAFLGGLYAVGWTQGYSTVLPYLEFGDEATLVAEQIAREFTAPFVNAGYYEWVALCFTLIVGTCGLPHVLVRFYTVDNERTARWSCVWGLFFICLLYWGTATYAAFGTLLFDQSEALSFPFTSAQGDVVVVLTTQLANLPEWLVGLVAAGAVAAALATVSGLFISGSSAAAHDIYTNLYKPEASEREQLIVGRLTILGLGILVAATAIADVGVIASLVAVAFAIAGVVMFPVFFLGLWWEHTTREGARRDARRTGDLYRDHHQRLCFGGHRWRGASPASTQRSAARDINGTDRRAGRNDRHHRDLTSHRRSAARGQTYGSPMSQP